MNTDELEHFLEKHPQLYHMAEPGAWEGIQRNGLLSTSALLDLYGVVGRRRFDLESARRPESVPLTGRGLSGAVVRDQGPINENKLRQALPDEITLRDWYKFLNGKVFFWATRDRLYRMAKAYGDRSREVVVIDTRRFVDAYRDRIWLCHMNSGATMFPDHRRSYETFRKIADYPYAKRRKKVAEVCVNRSVPDVLGFVRCVRQLQWEKWGVTIYRSGGSAS